MKILAIESWYGGSHKQWLDDVQKYSSHSVEILGLPDRNWKWRMQGGAGELSKKFKECDFKPDLILSSSMVDLSLFDALSKTQHIPKVIYFHENQFAYPISPRDTDNLQKTDQHYSFINVKSALVADKLLFNSQYNLSSFTDGVNKLKDYLPGEKSFLDIENIKEKSEVLPLGFNLPTSKPSKKENKVPIILWNHRFEYDKNPDEFFNLMIELKEEGFPFKLIILGEGSDRETLWKQRLSDVTIHWGKADSREDYLRLVSKASILPVTSNQDFFGISIIEAISKGVFPILPRRLSYPELIPKESHTDVFYTSHSDLKEKIKSYDPTKSTMNLIDFIQQFSWDSLISKYDSIFRDVVK
ncbi:MAG: DUF3524 domain-containing protein [Bacteriovoracaceae bacterium]|nr:DUF3524 domain-containing protein [Bacteriovoracaceae bacterium]